MWYNVYLLPYMQLVGIKYKIINGNDCKVMTVWERCWRKYTEVLWRVNLKIHAINSFVKKMPVAFGSTYICKQVFSIMNFWRGKCCFQLTDERLHDTVHGYLCFSVYIQKLARDTRSQKSHKWAWWKNKDFANISFHRFGYFSLIIYLK